MSNTKGHNHGISRWSASALKALDRYGGYRRSQAHCRSKRDDLGQTMAQVIKLGAAMAYGGVDPHARVTTTGAWQIEEKDTVSNDDNMLLDDNSVLDEYITYVYGVNPADVSFRV